MPRACMNGLHATDANRSLPRARHRRDDGRMWNTPRDGARMRSPASRSALVAIIAGGLVLGYALGSRHVQGLFMMPLVVERGWSREVFAFSLGLQALAWGFLQPVTGALADRYGSARVIALGCLVYGAGLLLEAVAATPASLHFGAGVLTGVALTATAFATIYAAVARLVPPERRGWAQGLAGAIAGMVQFLLVPIVQLGIGGIGWSATLQWMALASLGAAAVALLVDDRAASRVAGQAPPSFADLRLAAGQALRHRGFWLVNLGFLSCGFQLAFLAVHLPAYLLDQGLSARDGVACIALIAFFNTIGTYLWGRLGDTFRRKYLLAILYAIRTGAMILFVALPLSPWTVYGFAIVMGSTWLGTVPLTNGVVAQIFGVRYLATLFGLVFLGHQLGGFMGAWLSGVVFDATGSYGLVWTVAIGLGLASVAFNLPVDDRAFAVGDAAPHAA
jgi:MFS family permease